MFFWMIWFVSGGSKQWIQKKRWIKTVDPKKMCDQNGGSIFSGGWKRVIQKKNGGSNSGLKKKVEDEDGKDIRKNNVCFSILKKVVKNIFGIWKRLIKKKRWMKTGDQKKKMVDHNVGSDFEQWMKTGDKRWIKRGRSKKRRWIKRGWSKKNWWSIHRVINRKRKTTMVI